MYGLLRRNDCCKPCGCDAYWFTYCWTVRFRISGNGATDLGWLRTNGISVAAIYHPVNGQLAEVAGSGGVSPVDAPRTLRNDEAKLADGWFNTITSEVFG